MGDTMKVKLTIIKTTEMIWTFDPDIVTEALGTEEPFTLSMIPQYIGENAFDADEFIAYVENQQDTEDRVSIDVELVED